MNGVPILKNSTIRVHDNNWDKKEKIGKVIWKNGSYVCSGTSCEYNIFAWRKNIEVIDKKYSSKFEELHDEYEELASKFERTEFGVLTPFEHRNIFRKAFRLGWESRIEKEHYNEEKEKA